MTKLEAEARKWAHAIDAQLMRQFQADRDRLAAQLANARRTLDAQVYHLEREMLRIAHSQGDALALRESARDALAELRRVRETKGRE